MMVEHRPTLESLAAELGVSRQTISNAINRPDVVAPETLARVRARIEASGYAPSRAARQLRTARSRTIGFRIMPVHDGINGHILSLFLHELVEQAARDGYHLAVFAADDDDAEIAVYERMLASREIDGVVLTSTHSDDKRVEWLLAADLPFVAFGRPWSEDDDAAQHDWVDVDGAAGTHAVTTELAARGHTRIGYISWPYEAGVSADRYAGWRHAMAETGILPEPAVDELVRYCPDISAEGMHAAIDLIDSGATALVCASDTLAIGALGALGALGSGQPGPIGTDAVVGFDDTPVARALGLSSVTQPIVAAARKAMATLLARLAGESAPSHVLLPPTPVFRDREPSTLIAEQSLHRR